MKIGFVLISIAVEMLRLEDFFFFEVDFVSSNFYSSCFTCPQQLQLSFLIKSDFSSEK
jgi:hypothetical protein